MSSYMKMQVAILRFRTNRMITIKDIWPFRIFHSSRIEHTFILGLRKKHTFILGLRKNQGGGKKSLWPVKTRDTRIAQVEPQACMKNSSSYVKRKVVNSSVGT
jgi:hypothetical protein